MWTNDVITAINKMVEEWHGDFCLKSISPVPFSPLIKILTTNYEVWFFDPRTNTLTMGE